MSIKIGAQYYTIREFCRTLDDFDDSCKKVSEIGYKYIQLSGIGDFSAQEIRPIIKKYGLEVVCTHRPASNYLENLENEIEFHKSIGCNICGIGCMPEFNAKPETIENFIKNFKPIANRLSEEGLVFAYHNHAFDFEKINGKFAFDIIFEKMSSENFKSILDVYWLAYAGINPAEFIMEYKENIALVHFKDLRIVDNKPQYAEIGNGNLNWESIILACENAGVCYALVEQDECESNPFDSLKISYDYLMKRGIE